MYILECADGSYYVGSTFDLGARIEQHWNGSAHSYTQRRRPFRLVYAEEFDSVVEAFDAEMKVKRWSRAKKLALIEGRWEDLRQLSKKPKRG
jgi:predicted GIY-YIG superfamily endonuclease